MQRRSVVQVLLLGVAGALLVGCLALSHATASPADELGSLTLSLAIVVAAALLGGNAAAWTGQPAVLGELAAGILLGNLPGLRVLQFVGGDPYLDVLSRVGMLLLLFAVGLDLSVRSLFSVGISSLFVAVIGTVASLALGSAVAAMCLPNAPAVTHLFLGAAITATSIGITARVLRDIGRSKSRETQVIVAAAVVDDVLALVILGGITAWVGAAGGAQMSPTSVVVAPVMKTVGFLVLAIVLGAKLTPSWFRQAARFRTHGALLAAGLCICFLASWAASTIGLAALVGAFAAGLVLEDAHSAAFVRRGEPALDQLLQPIVSFLVPVFFVLVGFHTDLRGLLDLGSIALPLGLTGAAILGKLCCAAGVGSRGANRLSVATGMIPRGEVTLVFAALGGAIQFGGAPLLDRHGYVALVAVVILTTVVTPPALKWSARDGEAIHE